MRRKKCEAEGRGRREGNESAVPRKDDTGYSVTLRESSTL